MRVARLICPVCQAPKATPLYLGGDRACSFPAVVESMSAPYSDPALVGKQWPTDAMEGMRKCKKCGAFFWFFYSELTSQVRTATREWVRENGAKLTGEDNGEAAQQGRGDSLGGHPDAEGNPVVCKDSGLEPEGQGLPEREQESPQGDKPPASARAD